MNVTTIGNEVLNVGANHEDEWHCGFKRFRAMKKKNHHIKLLMGVGGECPLMACELYRASFDPKARWDFAKSVLELVLDQGFDGADLNLESWYWWEKDLENVIHIARDMAVQFKAHGKIVSVTLSGDRHFWNQWRTLSVLGQYVDMVNVQAYNFWKPAYVTQHHSPLCDCEATNSVVESMNAWTHIVPASKINLGVPAFGRCFQLDDAKKAHGMNAPQHHVSEPGPFTRRHGIRGYNEICASSSIEKGECHHEWDKTIQAPYTWCDDGLWCAFDDGWSMILKTHLSKLKGLGGMMMYSIDMDDFHGDCKECRQNKPFHLLHDIQRVQNGSFTPDSLGCDCDHKSTVPFTTSEPTTPEAKTTAERTTTTKAPMTTHERTTEAKTTKEAPTTKGNYWPRPTCTKENDGKLFPNEHCDHFWQCGNNHAYLLQCRDNLFFNPKISVCDQRANVDQTHCMA